MTTIGTTLPRLGQWRDQEELARLQDARLAGLFEQAAKSPFYRDRIATHSGRIPTERAEFSQLPLTTKQDLRDNYPYGLLAVPRERLATYHESSGTAGQPTASYYTADDWTDLTDRYARKWVPIHSDDMFLVRTPYALMITGHLAHAAARRCGATVVPGDNRSLAMPYSRVVRVLHDLGVTLTWSMPTETLMWAAAARAAGLTPGTDFPSLRALYVGGEPLSQARRTRISQIWGVPVVQEYGSTETGSLAGECRYGRMHLWADRAIFEVYDPHTGAIRRTGRGQLIVTPLYREAMPLLRYNLADDVRVSDDTCECEWQLPTVQVYGRSAFEYSVGQAHVTQDRLERLVFELPTRYGVLFWRARANPTKLTVQIEVPDEHRNDACASLTAAIERTYLAPCEVSGVSPGTLIPTEVLTGMHDVLKPRALFGAEEDWDRALLYY